MTQSSERSRKGYIVFSWILTIAVMAFIFGFSAQDSDESLGMSARVKEFLLTVLNIDISEFFIRKAAHFSEYAILGFLLANSLSLSQQKKIYFKSFLVGSLYAALDEWHQYYVPGREARALDILIDSSGVLFGVFVKLILISIHNKKN